jgi:hypothetical protein
MEEPDGCINADAETTLAGRIGVEAILDSELGKRANLPGRSQNLKIDVSW